MRKYSRVLSYLKDYKGSILIYLVSILLSITFSILSLAMLFPFLQLLFGANQTNIGTKSTSVSIVNTVNQYLAKMMSEGGAYHALSIVCVFIILCIFLKNLFYISQLVR